MSFDRGSDKIGKVIGEIKIKDIEKLKENIKISDLPKLKDYKWRVI